MRVKRLDHITVNVKNLKESFEFYQSVLGLEKLNTVDMGDHVLHYFRLYEGCRLELIEYLGEQKSLTTGNTDLGIYRHFAVVVKNLEEIKKVCEQKGYRINLPPTYIGNIGLKIMLIQDPNGVEIETIEG